jgi:hypothetical protein
MKKMLLVAVSVSVAAAFILWRFSNQCPNSTAGAGFSSALSAAIKSSATDGQVSLNEVTDFSWDAVYIFGPYSSSNHMERVVGCVIACIDSVRLQYRDDVNLLVFTRGSETVLVPVHRAVADFKFEKSNNRFSPQTARFVINRDEGMVYLTPSNRPQPMRRQ